MGDVEQGSGGSLPGFPTSKSYESLSSLTSNSESSTYRDHTPAESRDPVTACLSPEDLDDTLMQLESGVDLALERAKVWSKYAKDVICYVEKRIHLETEFARNLSKLAATTRPTLKEESYLPFQSTYLMGLEHDIEYANNCETTYAHIQGHKFVEQLETRRTEHDKKRKAIRTLWSNIKKEMSECRANLEKSRQLYYTRSHDFEKARDSVAKTEDVLTSSGGASSAKLEKKRKVEEDALLKAKEAETTYKACVVEANAKQQEMGKVKKNLLVQLRELVYQCDQTMRAVTVSYFQLQHSLSAPAPVQYQTLCEQSRSYEPGVQFSEFVRQYRSAGSASRSSQRLPFIFEPYITGGMQRERKPSAQSFDSLEEDKPSSPQNKTPQTTKASNSLDDRDNKARAPVHAWVTQPGISDSDSMSGSSTKSMDHSPSASPMNGHRNLGREVSSGDELGTGEDQEVQVDTGEAKLNEPVPSSFKNLNFSKAAQTHVIRKLRTPSKCRECDSYVYFNGAECERCGLACHKKCLETLWIQCGGKRLMGKMNVFGVDLKSHLRETGKEVPFLVTKCISEIDTRALHTKGIYRVAGLKVKVEKLCQTFENGQDLVDISEIQPHLITSVLKLYLRQLPEPLLTYHLYPEFIALAKQFPGEVDKADEERLKESLLELIDKLPVANWKVASILMHHLKRVGDAHETNKMSSSNLGIIFGPTLLKPLDNSASLSALVDMQHQTRIIELLIHHAQVLGGVIGGMETPVEDFQSDSLELSPGEASLFKSDRPSKSYLDDTSMPGFLLPGSSEDNDHQPPTSPGRAEIESLEEEDEEEEEEGEGEEREGRSSRSEEEEVDELGGGNEPADNSDPDSANPDSPKREHRLRRQPVKRGGNYTAREKVRAAAAAGGVTPPSPSRVTAPSGDDFSRSHSNPGDMLGSSPDPTTQDSDFQGYVPSAYSRQQPQRKPVGIRHSLPISNPATTTTRNRNILSTHDEAEGSDGATQSSLASGGMVRSSSTKTGREPRFV